MDNMSETERLNKNCEHCGHPLGFSVMGEYCTNRACSYIDGHYSGPKEVVAPEKTYSQAEFNTGIAGAYAAAAKLCELHAADADYMDEGVERMVKAAHHFDAKTILALTPAADARQASQQLERMACGHLKADEITICDDMGCIQNSHQREYNLDCRCGGRWVTKCGICAAIASAEARARLEAAQLCDEMGRNGKGLFEASEALYKLAAARTPASTKGSA